MSAPSSLVCQHCGAPIAARARSCPVCGRALEREYATLSRALRPGSRLAGRYIVERMLSKGGMGALYLAADRDGDTVVIKALGDYFDPQNEGQVQAARERLAQEARTLASLDHPAIPRFVASFQDGPQIYVAMQRIAGVDLERRLSSSGVEYAPRHPYALTDVMRWGVALCGVLEYLSTRPQPVIHHDIKPANVLVDSAGNRVWLVDFGTAQSRLDPSGEVGLAQSSLYGTVGYAPPEQYRGRSEPRSDVYALAATLYHLATDDDPGDHPFSFPRLETLGALGDALRAALDHDVRRRPQALELRARLEILLAAAGGALLRAPDGTWLPDRAALVAWCLARWDWAADWLHDGLPEQVELWWRKAGVTRGLLEARQITDRNVALDTALAQLDPQGIGRESPLLSADVPAVDFGALPNEVVRRDVTIVNAGRRFVNLYVFLPRWVRGSSTQLALAPGQRTTLSLSPDLDRVYVGGRLRGEVLIRDHYGRRPQDVPLLRIPVAGSVPLRHILGRYRRPIGGAGIALLFWAGAGFPQPPPSSSTLLEARIPVAAALAGQRGAAQHLLDASASIERGEWLQARTSLRALLADNPRNPAAHQLLRETYYRASESARARGDLAGARAELEMLLLRYRSEVPASDLLREIRRLQRVERSEREIRP